MAVPLQISGMNPEPYLFDLRCLAYAIGVLDTPKVLERSPGGWATICALSFVSRFDQAMR